MIAYKFLAAGARGPFSGFAWPLPGNGRPGEWVEAEPALCASGIHACLAADIPFWLNAELWEIELDAPERDTRKLVAPRGRLVRRVEAWDHDTMKAFAESCAERTAARAATSPGLEAYASDIRQQGGATLSGFIAARAAEIADGPDGYDREREAQAAWLAHRLGLAG